MEIDRKELKLQARERIALTDPKYWVVALSYIALTTGVAWVVSLLPLPELGASPIPLVDTLHLFLSLLLQLYTTVVRFGLCLWALWAYRQLDPGINSLTQGFSVAGSVILMRLSICVRILGWYFLVSLGLGIPMFGLLMTVRSYEVGLLFLGLISAALIAALIVISLRYALAPYLLADRPEDGPFAPIYHSSFLMRGWKMQLFKLELSFIGYDLINLFLSTAVIFAFLGQAGLLTAAAVADPVWQEQCSAVIYSVPVTILSRLVTIPVSLWLLPYRAAAQAGFYDARILAAQQEVNPSDPPPR